MKRWAFILAIALVSGVVAHELYTALRPTKPPEVCSMEWLAAELALSPAQSDAVWAIHVRRCAEICRLDGERAACPTDMAATATQACRLVTQQLIRDVCAELTPPQRQKYLQLVAPCLAAAEAKP